MSTSAFAVIVAAASPAMAQSQPATPPDPNVTAQTTPAPDQGSPQTDDAVQTASGQDQAADNDETIVVTGLRRSLQSARNIKRNSQQIVDAVVAEDIGKLPDVTASAALARITGVQVNRSAGEAAQVQIRGLPDISTTYNSREIFTAENRFVAIQDFPAGSVAALEVFKSGTADQIEGGLGGQVNVRGRRPFDFSGLEISGSLNAVRFEQRGEWDWNGNILVSNRWAVGDGGEFGVLVNAAMTNLNFLDSTRENDRFIDSHPATATTPAFTAPNGSGLFYGGGNRWRPSVNASIQYKPNPDLQFYADGLFQGYRGHDSNFWMFVPLFGATTFSDVELQGDGDLARSVRTSNAVAPDGYAGFSDTKTNTYQVGGGAIWDRGPIRVSGDIAYTDSVFTDHNVNVDYALASSPDRIVVFDHDSGPGGASFDFINFDTTDPDNYLYRGLYQHRRKAKGDDVQARLDLEYRTGIEFLPRVQFGVRHNNRDASLDDSGTFYRPAGAIRPPLSTLPMSIGVRPCGFEYDNYQHETCFIAPSFNGVFGNLDALRAFATTQNPDGGPVTDAKFDPLQHFSANEKASAIYAQAHYQFDVGFPIDGNVGMRAVHTKDRIRGNSRDAATNEIFPTSQSNSYTDWLPNVSARLEFLPSLQMRLAYTQTRTRPNFVDLSPGTTFNSPPLICTPDPTVPGSGPDNPNCFRTGFGGNPNLKPINSNNMDATLEYYFGRTGSASVALFRRRLNGFVFRNAVESTDPEFGRVRLDQPTNAGKGKIWGVELAATTFFDYDWLPDWARGFGAQANFTYIDASTELAPFFQDQLPGQQHFPGVSKYAYNLVAMYEKYNITARLAYNWRSKFVVDYEEWRGFKSPLIQKSLGQLDFSTSYTPIENLTIAFDALNILAGKQPIRTEREFRDGDVFPWGVKYLERVYSIGVRFRFGGRKVAAAPEPAPLAPPPPPPAAEPAPPPPPPAAAPERG